RPKPVKSSFRPSLRRRPWWLNERRKDCFVQSYATRYTQTHRDLLLLRSHPRVCVPYTLNVWMPHKRGVNFAEWRVSSKTEHSVIHVAEQFFRRHLFMFLETGAAGVGQANSDESHTLQKFVPIYRSRVLGCRHCHSKVISGQAKIFLCKFDLGFELQEIARQFRVVCALFLEFFIESLQKGRGLMCWRMCFCFLCWHPSLQTGVAEYMHRVYHRLWRPLCTLLVHPTVRTKEFVNG